MTTQTPDRLAPTPLSQEEREALINRQKEFFAEVDKIQNKNLERARGESTLSAATLNILAISVE